MSFLRSLILRFALVSLLVVGAASSSPSDAATGRAVSLRALSAAVKSGSSRQAIYLCGITKVNGYLVDTKTQDIILIGEVNPALPPLYLDDFVVALRNVWLAYAPVRGRIRYYSAPGCSIDPNPKTLRGLQDVGDKINTAQSAEEMKQCLEDWRAVGGRPQKVRVMGVPYDTRFAKVMVGADYYMKRLVNGSVSLGIDGFESLTDLTIRASRGELIAGKRVSVAAQSLNRFWFCPGDTTFEEEDGVVLLRSCRVQLLTEEEFLTEHDSVTGMGRPSPLAKHFAVSFTNKYADIASARPIYKELEGLFRFVGIARLMREPEARRAARASLGYLLNAYRVNNVPVSREVPGLVNIKDFTREEQTPDGTASARALLPSCGGVSIDIRPRRIRTVSRPARSSRPSVQASIPISSSTPAAKPSVRASDHALVPARRVTSLRKTVLSARKSTGALVWDFPISSGK
ncbi:MAG: DUF1598 domain-containing protein [Chloroflexi bacterium]|nr:DUF1598 domain-containing protein [Chloroflexota bacterium]MCL5105252.1 DUF1598 domain-containing protein [Armatimonadota bacterium]